MASALEVLDPGALTTVQDRGRAGLAHVGVPRAGALDAPAARRANLLVGNEPEAAVLETTATGCRVRATGPVLVAVTGAPCEVFVGPVLGGAVPAPFGSPLRLAAGQELEVGPAQRGLRTYIAVRGGVDVEPVLGSRSTDTLSRIGPTPLAKGDRLPVGASDHVTDAVFATLRAERGPDSTGERRGQAVELPLRLGPRDSWFTPDALASLTSSLFTVSVDSNRVGLRLTGPALARVSDREIASEGMVLGAVQVPPSGQPVVFLADHPTTGGYPVIGVVDAAGLAAAGQARPGDTVRFALLVD